MRGSATLFAPLNGAAGSYAGWASLTVLSMFAIMFLPRQFQIAVVENVNENHLSKAIWLFPLYMLAMNVFVIPVAFGGVMHFSGVRRGPGHVRADAADGGEAGGAALLVFIGGLSAATGMVIVETIALSTMVCNDLVMPVLLRMPSLRLAERQQPDGTAAGNPAGRDRRRRAARATSISASPARPMRWWPSASFRSPRSRSSRPR